MIKLTKILSEIKVVKPFPFSNLQIDRNNFGTYIIDHNGDRLYAKMDFSQMDNSYWNDTFGDDDFEKDKLIIHDQYGDVEKSLKIMKVPFEKKFIYNENDVKIFACYVDKEKLKINFDYDDLLPHNN